MTASVRAERLAIGVGSTVLASDIDLDLSPGSRLAVVGPNGCGKSTLLRVLAGDVAPMAGVVTRSPESATVSYLPQLRLDSAAHPPTCMDVLAERTGVAAAQAEFDLATADLTAGAPGAEARYGAAWEVWQRRGVADVEARAARLQSELGTDVPLDRDPGTLSGGELARLGLLAVLLTQADVLLLDEPTNDLDAAGLAWLTEFLQQSPAAVALVTHDRYLLRTVATGVLEFDPRLQHAATFAGGFDAWQTERERAHEAAAAAAESAGSQIEALRRQAQAVRASTARGRRHADRAYARGRVDKMTRDAMRDGASQGGGRAGRLERQAERVEVPDGPRKVWELQLRLEAPATSGPEVVAGWRGAETTAHGCVGPVNLTLYRGDRLLLDGPNGSGKTIALELLLGMRTPDRGEAWVAPGVTVGLLDQHRRPPAPLSPSHLAPTAPTAHTAQTAQAVAEQPLGGLMVASTGLPAVEVRTLLAKFGLGADDLNTGWRDLSPGERTRALLAQLSVCRPHLIVLDEPTNHLDLPGAEALEAALADYEGTLIVVTHDRAFGQGLTFTRRLELTSDGR